MPLNDPITSHGDPSLVPPEEQGPGSGHNSEGDAFERAMRRQISLNAEREELNARINKARKQMKADGVVLGKLDDTIKKMAWTPQEIREDIATTLRYARYAGFSIGSLAVDEGGQVDLFGHTDDEEVAAADWKARGRADALRLKPAKVPKECPPDYHQAYLAGHAEACWWSDEAPLGHSDNPMNDERLVNEYGEWVDPEVEDTDGEFAEARKAEGIE